jgi:LPS-assembly lipoprotein
MSRNALLVWIVALLLAGCGFHLRGQTSMLFQSIYVVAPNPDSPFVRELRRNLLVSKVRLADSAEQADVTLNIVSETVDKQILSLGGDGHVNEYRLMYRVSLRAFDHQQREWIPAEEMALRRDFSYDDTQILAKEAEENLLYQSLRSDMAQQILRRLSHAQPLAMSAP